MKFVNFSFSNPVQSSTLIGLGCEWDLHNYSDFAGFKFDPLEDCLRIEWLVPAVENPWGCTENRTKGCALKFKNLKRVEVTARDKATLSLEDACLLGISKVIPDRTEHRFKAVKGGQWYWQVARIVLKGSVKNGGPLKPG